MLHKRYNYRKPLLWMAFLLALFLKTNTVSQIDGANNNFGATIKILSLQKVPISDHGKYIVLK